ncbi:golgin subfamily A member 6-like protein 25 [Penaeus indicus]|uniref:golgin subfamily A member 6-like protein 25 n=1 Tax=Penaeus indicus TaxID=29960 RepID=UPI00300CF1BB
MGIKRTPRESLPSWLSEVREDGDPSALLKEQLLGLKGELEQLEGRVSALSVADADAALSVNFSKMRDIESILTKVAQIRNCFKTLKGSGQSRFGYLEAQEEQLSKDIRALRESLSEDRNYLEGTQNAGVRATNAPLKSNLIQCDRQGEDHASIGVISSAQKPNSVQRKIDNEMPLAMPQFKHHWEERDHQVFIKVYHKFKGKQRRREEWIRVLAYKTESEIDDHLVLYDNYLLERNKMREKLGQWKQERELKRIEEEGKIAEKQKDREKELQAKNQAKEERLKREREERNQRLALWKASRGRSDLKGESDMGQEVKVEKSSLGKVKPQSYTREERKIIAKQLQEYCHQKELARTVENQRKQEEKLLQKKLYNANSRLNFRKKDEEYIKYLKEQRERQKKLEDDHCRKLEQLKLGVQVNIERSRDRLFQLTQSRVAYTSSPRESGKFNTMCVNSISKLGTPTWRQDL